MNKVLVLGFAVVLLGCTNGEGAVRALEGAGYTNIKITGYRVFGCSEDDLSHTGFTATGPSGKPVTGVVCGGLLKGATIRTD